MTQTKILAFAGQRQSAKTTMARHIFGYTLASNNIVPCWKVVNSELIVPVQEGEGFREEIYPTGEPTELNINTVWPLCRIYNYAEPLKDFVSRVFGIPRELMAGTDKDKNTPINIIWSDLPKECFTLHKKDFPEAKTTDNLTVRQLLQSFGTNICRKISTDCWVNATLNEIASYPNKLAVIGDCRFGNEVLGVKQAGGRVIKLTRSVGEPTHESEKALLPENFDQSLFDAVLDNSQMDEKTQQTALFDILGSWGWVENEIKTTI